MDACDAGEADVVRALCESGANVHLYDTSDGVSAMHCAVECAERSEAADGTRLRPTDQLWRLPMDEAARPRTDGAACMRILREFGDTAGKRARVERAG